jgi:formylglycine-generating enzyme required for sulfatase activity
MKDVPTNEIGFRCALSADTASPQSTPQPDPVTNISSEQITDSKGVSMMLVPEGIFTMGSDYGYDDEKPVHEVYLDSFYIDKYEVTNVLYKTCVVAGVCNAPRDAGSNTRSSYYYNVEFDNYPVIYVNWGQAKTYCEWRGAELPTEAQWEKAARGTNGPDPWWKDAIDCGKSKYFQCTNDTAEVGSYIDGVSPYGAYDMVGNVWEWVSDWYSSTYYSVSPANNPQGPSSGKFRALRGGFYFFNNHWFNSGTHRSGTARSYIYDHMIGFRCAKDATP